MFTRLIILAALVFLGVQGIEQGQQFEISSKVKSQSLRSPASAVDSKKLWTFEFKDLTHKKFQIKKEAPTYEEAYKLATKDCFQRLTGGNYPGEEKGLDIIDICVNPKI